MTNADDTCELCGHGRFVAADVLWPELVEAWQLNPDERAYIDIQQGTSCERCAANVRSQALARAVLGELGASAPFSAYLEASRLPVCHLLEINEAGALTPWLSRLPGHVLARYPECDMTNMPFASETFDYVVHSDTLEHVANPQKALEECRRVLVPGGKCLFTVPIILGRMTRSRAGLPPSYHGHAECRDSDFMVHTEFGADVWTSVLACGFRTCGFVTFRYPSGIAIVAGR